MTWRLRSWFRRNDNEHCWHWKDFWTDEVGVDEEEEEEVGDEAAAAAATGVVVLEEGAVLALLEDMPAPVFFAEFDVGAELETSAPAEVVVAVEEEEVIWILVTGLEIDEIEDWVKDKGEWTSLDGEDTEVCIEKAVGDTEEVEDEEFEEVELEEEDNESECDCWNKFVGVLLLLMLIVLLLLLLLVLLLLFSCELWWCIEILLLLLLGFWLVGEATTAPEERGNEAEEIGEGTEEEELDEEEEDKDKELLKRRADWFGPLLLINGLLLLCVGIEDEVKFVAVEIAAKLWPCGTKLGEILGVGVVEEEYKAGDDGFEEIEEGDGDGAIEKAEERRVTVGPPTPTPIPIPLPLPPDIAELDDDVTSPPEDDCWIGWGNGNEERGPETGEYGEGDVAAAAPEVAIVEENWADDDDDDDDEWFKGPGEDAENVKGGEAVVEKLG